MKIQPDQALIPLSPYFVCKVCLEVVSDPQMCRKCEELICKDCLDQWQLKKQSCMICDEEFD